MATSVAIPAPYSDNLFKRVARLIPGLFLLIAVGYAGKFVEQWIARYGKAHHLTLPNIEYVLWAILIGLVISNTVGIPAAFRPGLATYEFSLKACIVVLALGAVALFTFPLIGHWLGMGDTSYGLWAGLGVDNTAEATAAGALYSDAAGKVAVLAKTARNAMIGFVVLGYAIYWARKQGTAGVTHKAAFLWRKFPKFVLGFLLISALATASFFNPGQITSLGNLSRWAFLLTFAGVGLRTNIGEMRKQGLRPFLVGAIGEVAVALLTLGLVLGAARFLH